MLIQQFNANITKYIALWRTIDGRAMFTDRHPWIKRQYRFFRIRRQLKRVLKRIAKEDLTIDSSDLKNDPHIGKLLDTWLQFDVWHMDASIDGDYAQVTKAFINRARSMWPDMPNDDIFQALRNVWIMIAIQILAEIPVALTDAMFAYSMLYPLTDNVIDHPDFSKAEKAAFIVQLGQRLKGIPVMPATKFEKDAFDMVTLIEATFCRTEYPDVYNSILLIHDAQKRSLAQQYSALDENELMQLSFEKGAASVVADGFLVLGHLAEDFLEFLTAYGIVLQLADDLQDLEIDAANGHKTLFNLSQSPIRLAEITQKLSAFSFKILEIMPTKNSTLKEQMSALLGKSMQILIYDAIHTHETLYPKPFYRRVNRSYLMGLENHARLKHMSQAFIQSKFDS